MSATDEARAVLAEAAWSVYRGEHGYTTVPTSPDTGADFSAGFEAGWDVRDAEVERLTAQLQAAQATIAAALAVHGADRSDQWRGSLMQSILSRADTSARDAAILAAKAEGWQNCVSKFASYGHLVKGAALDRAESENPYVDDPYRASIEQTEAE